MVLLILIQGTKRLVDRPRPAATLNALESLPGGHLRQHAFPSGHSAFGAYIAGVLAFSAGSALVAAGAVSGNGLSGSAGAEGATFTVTSNATNNNTGSTIVFRDSSGDFAAGTITATLTGTATNATHVTVTCLLYTSDAADE